MAKGGVMRTLVGHFFRRFFDNDTVHVQGETLTTVVRAIAIVAAPGELTKLMKLPNLESVFAQLVEQQDTRKTAREIVGVMQIRHG